MRQYTTLGTGKNTKVLSVSDYHPARTVTTTTAEVASAVAVALRHTDTQMPYALYDLAVDADGTPTEARRHLLGAFANTLTGEPALHGGHWEAAETLVTAVATTIAGQPAAVAAAVRTELADHLTGFDGVLVPARINTYGYKRACADVCVSGPLEWLGDTWWNYLLGTQSDLSFTEDDDLFPLGGQLISSVEISTLPQEIYDAVPIGYRFTDFSIKELHDLIEDDGMPWVNIRADHFAAWVAHHRPDQLDTLRQILAAAPSS